MQENKVIGDHAVRDFSLRTRVLGTFVILIVVTAGGFVGAWSLLESQYRQDVAVINEAGRQRMRIQKMVVLAHRIAGGEEDKREELRAVAAQFEETLTAFQGGDSSQRLPAAPPRVQSQVQAVRAEWKEIHSLLETILQKPPTSTAFQGALADLQDRSGGLLDEADRTVQLYQAAHEEEMETVRWLLGGTVLVLLGLIGLILFFAHQHVARPLARLTREASRIAEGELDGTVTVVDNQDEIGALTRSIQAMKNQLAGSLKEVKIFRTVVEHAGHSIYWTDRDGTIEHVNPAFEAITGYSRGEAVGETPELFQSGEHDEAFYEDLWDTITEGEVWEGEFIDQRPEGEKYVVNQTIAPITNGEGQIEHFVAVGHDVTEQRKYEQALQEERDRFATLFENLPTPVVRCEVGEEETMITAANPAFEDTFGIERPTARGEDIDELLVPNDRQEEASEIECLALQKKSLQTEVKRRTTEDLRDFQLQVAGRTPEEGRSELYAIYTDITERKEREAHLERQNERLDRFASALSHDLRNPLNVAKGRLRLAREADKMPPEAEEHLAAVERSLDRMNEIAGDMLTMTWGGQSLETEDLSACSVSGVARASWKHVDTMGARLSVEAPPTIQAHEGRLQRLLENLFRNALEHGGQSVTIRVGGLSGSGFFVEDDGPGIPEEKRKHVFDLGYSTREEGTGMGLSIVKTIGETHGWTVSVTEGKDGGARFEFSGVELADGDLADSRAQQNGRKHG